MAVFNPDPGFGSPPSWQGASHGVIPNTGAATIIEGLSDAVRGVAKVADYNIQQNIRSDVNSIFDATNAAAGLDEQAGYGTAPNATSIPPELKGTKDAFSRFLQAREAGKISDSHYWSLLTTSMKEVKAKYPGYSEQIDNIYQDVTGSKPALALRNSLMQDYAQAQQSGMAAQSKLEQHLWDMRDEIETAHPGFFSNREAYAGKEQEVITDALKVSSDRQAVTAETSRLNMLASQNKLTNDMAAESYAKTAENIVQHSIDSKMNELIGGKEFSDLLEQATKGPPDPQMLEVLNAHVNALEANARMDLNKVSTEDYVLNIPASERQAIEDKAIGRIQFLRKLISDKDTGSAFYYARLNKVMSDRNLNVIHTLAPDTAVVESLPAELRNVYLQMNKGGSDIVKSLTPGLLTSTFGGQQGVHSVLDGINKEKGLSVAEKSNLATAYLQDIEKTFSARELDDQTVSNFVKKNFSQENPEAGQIMSLIAPGDRWRVYKSLTSPAIIDRIAKTEDKDSMQFYAAWARAAFDDVPDVNTALANISADMGRYSLTIDASQHKLVAIPSELTLQRAEQQARVSQVGTFGLGVVPGFNQQTSDPNTYVKREVDRANRSLQPINTSLANLMYVFQKAGMNPDEEFTNIMKEHGIDVKVQGDSKNVDRPLEQSTPGTGGKISLIGGVNPARDAVNRLAGDSSDVSEDLLGYANSGGGGGRFIPSGNYVARGETNVDAKLVDIIKEASARSGLTVEAFSGFRPGDSRAHGRGKALDVNIIGPDGKRIPNYQSPEGFKAYEQLARVARQVQEEKYPELGRAFRWGGYFAGGKGKYGAMDLMHFDLAGNDRIGMAGGSWDKGLTASQAELWGMASN